MISVEPYSVYHDDYGRLVFVWEGIPGGFQFKEKLSMVVEHLMSVQFVIFRLNLFRAPGWALTTCYDEWTLFVKTVSKVS